MNVLMFTCVLMALLQAFILIFVQRGTFNVSGCDWLEENYQMHQAL